MELVIIDESQISHFSVDVPQILAGNENTD